MAVTWADGTQAAGVIDAIGRLVLVFPTAQGCDAGGGGVSTMDDALMGCPYLIPAPKTALFDHPIEARASGGHNGGGGHQARMACRWPDEPWLCTRRASLRIAGTGPDEHGYGWDAGGGNGRQNIELLPM